MDCGHYSAIIVTFRRPKSASNVLRSLAQQTVLPSLVIAVDNDPERSAEEVITTLAQQSPFAVVYRPAGENLGPAGGWAEGVEMARTDPRRGEWVTILDDDDPIEHPAVMAALADAAAHSAADVAAIGLRGARIDRRWARLRRVGPASAGNASVDYLASGGAPWYRWSTIEGVGFFDRALFFGFEDLDLGLRIRRAGQRLAVVDLESLHHVADTARTRAPWREYYKTRALVVICRRHLGRFALAVTIGRALVLGSAPLLIAHRQPSLVAARWWGVVDGVRGRLGRRRYVPAENPPKR